MRRTGSDNLKELTKGSLSRVAWEERETVLLGWVGLVDKIGFVGSCEEKEAVEMT